MEDRLVAKEDEGKWRGVKETWGHPPSLRHWGLKAGSGVECDSSLLKSKGKMIIEVEVRGTGPTCLAQGHKNSEECSVLE